MNITAKKFTYGGMFIGSTLGWYLPELLWENSSFFSRIGMSTLVAILGTIAGYQVYKYLKRKF